MEQLGDNAVYSVWLWRDHGDRFVATCYLPKGMYELHTMLHEW